jgi:hypothetical protein
VGYYAHAGPCFVRPPNRKNANVDKNLPPPCPVGPSWRHLAVVVPIHQLIRALDPPAVTSVSAPNTRSLIFVHSGVGPEAVRPVLGQVTGPPEEGWGVGGKGASSGLGSSQFLAGFRMAAPAPAKGK